MSEKIKAGDKVRSVMTWTTYSVERGDEFVVEDVRRVLEQSALLINGEWIPEGYFEPVYPEPWTEPETKTHVMLQRRTKGTEAWLPAQSRFADADAAKEWLASITDPARGRLKGLPQEYRILEVEVTERFRVIGQGETPPRETS